jgi:large subunit ribosomal protein L21
MFAVIKAGGKQYRVVAEDVIRIDRVAGEPGDVIEFGEVLLLGGDSPSVGAPTVSGATVAGEVLQHTRGDKVIAFKKRRRKNSRRKRGFRHDFSMIRITEILTDGAKPSKTPPARPERAARPPKVETAGGDEAEKKPSKAKTSAKSTAKTKAKTAAKGKAPPKKAGSKKPAAKSKK